MQFDKSFLQEMMAQAPSEEWAHGLAVGYALALEPWAAEGRALLQELGVQEAAIYPREALLRGFRMAYAQVIDDYELDEDERMRWERYAKKIGAGAGLLLLLAERGERPEGKEEALLKARVQALQKGLRPLL